MVVYASWCFSVSLGLARHMQSSLLFAGDIHTSRAACMYVTYLYGPIPILKGVIRISCYVIISKSSGR